MQFNVAEETILSFIQFFFLSNKISDDEIVFYRHLC